MSATPAGWSLGLVSRLEEARLGVDAPVRSLLRPEHGLDRGRPLHTAEHVAPRCAPHIVFMIGSDLSGPHVRADQVLSATDWVAAGIAVLDSDDRLTAPDPAADNAHAVRFVVGSPVPVAGIDLRLVGVVLEHDGVVVGTASGAAALGDPAAAVAWLVRSLAAGGQGLSAGDVVLSGGLVPAVPVTAGDTVVVSIDRIGSVELSCQ